MRALALGIDLGTSGVRSAVIDAEGHVLAMARGDYGTAEGRRDPEGWWRAVVDCIDAQMEALGAAGGDPVQIAGLAVDGTSGSLVLTDADLNPVTRAMMYDDGGLDAEAALIAAHAPDPHVAGGPGSALARALRLVAEDAAGRAVHLLHQADFIAARLMGRGGFTDVNNALKTGIDPATGLWPDWMAALPLPAQLLPEARLPGDALHSISPDIAKRFGLSSGAMVHAGTTDSIAAFLAAADPVPGAAVTSLGTTLAVKLCANRRIDAPEMGLYSHRIGMGWLVGGASNTGGGVLRGLFDTQALDRLSARIDPSIESPLDYYPLPRPGERFPVNDPKLQPRMTPRPADDVAFLHGLLEGIARVERQAYEAIIVRGAPRPDRIITAGGGASNQVWTAIRARVLGLPVSTAATPEAAVGAARLVAKPRRP
jgi:sugar (pentulose or hexulose) kinase